MPRFQPLVENFAAGEISPLAIGRVSSQQYKQGCTSMVGFFPEPHGGARTMGGTSFVAEVKDSSKFTRLIPFTVSRVDSYVIELGHLYARFYSDTGVVESSPSVPLEIVTPWTEDDLADIHVAQANDELYLVHEGYQPRVLTRTGSASFTIAIPTWITTGTVVPHWQPNSDGHADGFPRTVAFFQERLILGGSVLLPQTLWCSRTADFWNFTVAGSPVVDDDAVEYTIAAYTQDWIQWLDAGLDLHIGTSGNEFPLKVNGYLGATNPPNIRRASAYGSKHIQPVHIGTSTVFVQSTGRHVRSFDLNRAAGTEVYDSINLAWLAEHITDTEVVDIAYAQVPYSLLFAARGDGTLLSMTWDPSLGGSGFEGIGWARHPTDGAVESIATIPYNREDQLWLVVNRTVDGATKRYVEYMDWDLRTHCTFVYDDPGTPIAIVGGLSHLEGKVVDIIADGAVHPQREVSSGQISLDYSAGVIKVGLPYERSMTPVPFEGGNPAGTSLGATKRWAKITLLLHESGLPLVNGTRPPDRSPGTPMDSPEALITGYKDVKNVGYDRTGEVTVTMDLPLPCHVLAIFGHAAVNAG